MVITPAKFAKKMLAFYDQHGRKNLPWQLDKNGYRVWVSEIMLQQTQVKTVIPYYQKFMQSFPTVQCLAKADIDEVLHHWAGLGYYSRARNLHACAKTIVKDHAGEFPQNLAEIIELPGIGESTGGAILSLAYGKNDAILDGNVKRVLARVFLVDGWYGKSSVLKELWQLSREYTPRKRTGDFNQAMMDLGAGLCSRSSPVCSECPLATHCLAHAQDKTAEYPHRKPKKRIPTKQVVMYLSLNDENQILLNKRPPSGIWGGLWCLPELGSSGPVIKKPKVFDQFKHTFSHYHLEVDVLKSDGQKTAALVEDNSGMAWHNIDQIEKLALPTPIKKFLNKHF